MTDVFINAKYVGKVDNASTYVQDIRDLRRKGSLSIEVNVYFNERANEIYLWTDSGRARRPLIVVKNGKSLLTEKHIQQLTSNEITWADLVRQGIVEYIDAGEEENAFVAYNMEDLTGEHTHLEIESFAISGITASLVPFGNYTPSSRLIIGSKNQKQSLGFYAANYHIRMDMDANLLHYPHVPIVKTAIHDVTNYEEHPSGQNMIVAIMCYDGYNMEDGVILNKGSVQRGLARSTYFQPVSAEELRYSGGLIDEVSVPDKEVKGYRTEGDYAFLEGDGIIYPEAELKEGNVVIGRTSPPRFLSGLDEYNLSAAIRRESSISLKHGEEGIADFVAITENEEGNKLVQVRLRQERIPEIGDKFTSRHGQKGVTGVLVPQSDVPFSTSGVVPDLIFTPHGVSSRMTISHLIELVGGKVGALGGRFVDGTLFKSEKEEDLRKELVELGFNEDGKEVFVDGRTGKQMLARIYVGNMYYLRLRHMVANKMQSRARGPIQLLTRQPTEGKAKEGGLRLGEMEKDTFIAHGASLLLKERFNADRAVIPICEQSGLMGFYDARKGGRAVSPLHGDNSDMANVEMSYAFKLLLDEIRSLGVYAKLNLKNKY
ncbi:DNA-directed RNA polymerase subunit B [Candidatus Woesearchaeota archaeon CG10_big_fil_rev_8_21_14_0_10_32_24]|nr:MAG: DNA-directed RNA polymerase subunit B [Candidatus Woesearchaeota archaeon CG10_big_fil_rev_8_21_14_0_10_32_24]